MQFLFFVELPSFTRLKFFSTTPQQSIKSKRLKVLTAASSEVGAQLLACWCRAHALLKTPILAHLQRRFSSDVTFALSNKLYNISLFISDDILMTHPRNLDAAGQTSKGMIRCTLPINGNVSEYLTDFRQVLHVLRAGNNSQILNAFFKISVVFPLLETFRWKQHMRLQAPHQDESNNEDTSYLPLYLLIIGQRKLQDTEKKSIKLLSAETTLANISGVINQAFSDIYSIYHDETWMSLRAQLLELKISSSRKKWQVWKHAFWIKTRFFERRQSLKRRRERGVLLYWDLELYFEQ